MMNSTDYEIRELTIDEQEQVSGGNAGSAAKAARDVIIGIGAVLGVLYNAGHKIGEALGHAENDRRAAEAAAHSCGFVGPPL